MEDITCCGRKPRPYIRKNFRLCLKCDRAYDIASGQQIENYAWVKVGDEFMDRLKAGRLGEYWGIQLLTENPTPSREEPSE